MLTFGIDLDSILRAHGTGDALREPFPGALDGLRALMRDHAVFVHTTRSPSEVMWWLERHPGMFATIEDRCAVCRGEGSGPAWTRGLIGGDAWTCDACDGTGLLPAWTERGAVHVTQRRLPATAYIDDETLRFEDLPRALAALRSSDRPLGGLQHEECGFSWHWKGDAGPGLPTRGGEPVCPRCEVIRLTPAQWPLAHVPPLTVEDVGGRHAEISQHPDDGETVREMKQALCTDVLLAIAAGAPDAQRLAAAALRSGGIEFTSQTA